MLLEFALWSFAWSAFTTLSTSAVILGVLWGISTEKKKLRQRVDKPVDKHHWTTCPVCSTDFYPDELQAAPSRR